MVVKRINASRKGFKEGASESDKQELEKQLKREKSGSKEGASESAKQELKREKSGSKEGITGHAKEQVTYSDGVASMRVGSRESRQAQRMPIGQPSSSEETVRLLRSHRHASSGMLLTTRPKQ